MLWVLVLLGLGADTSGFVGLALFGLVEAVVELLAVVVVQDGQGETAEG